MDFNCLHLTDVHVGMKGSESLWPNVEADFFEDLGFLIKEAGPLDLVIITGDLTQKAHNEEFTELQIFLKKLWQRFAELDCEPKLVAVPGNHDLVRPSDPHDPALADVIKFQNDSHVQDAFWNDPKSATRKIVKKAFANYENWWNKTLPVVKPKIYKHGLLPGDFAATITKNSVKIGLLGLNSSFLQLTGAKFKGKLALSPHQFTTVCDGHGPDWCDAHDVCLLLTHHPPDWLMKGGKRSLEGEIHYPPKRFALHLFGHMHKSNLRMLAVNGTDLRRHLQGCSLFAMEGWGENKEGKRIHGYSLFQLRFGRSGGRLRVWPRKAQKRSRGGWNITLDSQFTVARGKNVTEWIPLQSSGKIKRTAIKTKKHREVSRKIAQVVGPRDYMDVHTLMDKLAQDYQQSSGEVSVLNIALDMEYTWSFLRDRILSVKWKALKWRSLMLDATSPTIKSVFKGSRISAGTAKTREDDIRLFCQSKEEMLKQQNIKFECKAYDKEPFIHGFLINNSLLVSFCKYDDDHFSSPYLRFTKEPVVRRLDDDIGSELVEAFRGWFEYNWRMASRPVWPIGNN